MSKGSKNRLKSLNDFRNNYKEINWSKKPMSKYKLLKMDACWADEFDIKSFSVVEEEKYLELVKHVENYFEDNDEAEISFGTNEFMEYYSADDEFIFLKKMLKYLKNILNNILVLKWELSLHCRY